VKRRQERQEKRSSWKRSWKERKSWMQGVGRRKRGETLGGGIGWLNQCSLPLQILSTSLSLSLFLSLTPTNTPVHSDWICVSMKSVPLPFPLHYRNLHIQPLHVCVCVYERLSTIPPWHSTADDGLTAGIQKQRKSVEYSLDLITFKTFFNFRSLVLFFSQTFVWNFSIIT